MTKTTFALVLALAAVSGCKPRNTGIGPAQQAGKAVDDAGQKVAQSLHAPVEKADEAKRKLEEAGQRAKAQIEAATEDASKGLDKATAEVGKKVERVGEQMQK